MAEPERGPAEVHVIAPPWLTGKWIVTPEQMLLHWLAFLRANTDQDFRFSGKWFEYHNGVWRSEGADAAADRAVGAFQRKVANDLQNPVTKTNRDYPREKLEADKMHNAMMRRALAELHMHADDFDAADALIVVTMKEDEHEE